MSRIVIVSPDRVAAEMAGPGVRALELARCLAHDHKVTIAAPVGSAPVADAPDVRVYDPDRPGTLHRLLANASVVVAPPLEPRLVGSLRRRRWIVDLYNPEPFEGLEHQRSSSRLERRVRDVTRIDRISFAIRSGTAFLCASKRQRDMWLGFLAACRRLDSDLYELDPELRIVIDIVPSGLPDRPPTAAAAPLVRGVDLPEDARILVWNGGLWDWLDPETVIRAVALLRTEDPRWALLFTGTARPSHRADMPTAFRAVELARELGLEEAGAVQFRPGWTPYAERGGLLLECDIGVCAHRATLETRFAFRTRILDFLWAGLPILYTEGDEWADRVRAGGLGEIVPPGDPEALAAGARAIAATGRNAYAGPLAMEAARNTWARLARPLLRLVAEVESRDPSRGGLTAGALALRFSVASAARRLLSG